METEKNSESFLPLRQGLLATILVAEDDHISQEFLRNLLAKAGYQVEAVFNGRQCLDRAVTLLPDLIIMDVGMPHIDGIQTCRELKANILCRQVPVIFVTGNTDDETLEAAFAAGGSDYVRKPVSRIELLARVQTAISQQRMARKLAEEEKLKGVLETAGGICHELNQPLQYVLGTIQLLMMDIQPGDPIYDHLDAIRLRVEQMGDMTRKLADITSFKTRKYVGGSVILDVEKSITGDADDCKK
jgi:CheY-like chemotaxis protein